MELKNVAKVLTVALGASLLCLACAAETSDTATTTDSTDQELSAAMTSCHTDDDCVAISAGGCCPNGVKVAVNATHEKAYDASHACKSPPKVCPLYVINDTRVAECGSAGKCQLVDIAKIKCGGFIAHPHECPTGYECDHTGVNPDLPGTCKEAPPPPPADCRTNGCGKGSTCSMCWGSYACIPKGAVC